MKNSGNKIFSLLIKLHIYGGLFSVPYLLIVGFSALNFQHHFLSEEPTDTITSFRHVEFDKSLKKDSLAKVITNNLQLVGHIPPWEFKKDEKGNLQFKVQRPALTYQITVNKKSKIVKVEEIHYGAGKILRALHFGSISELDDGMLKAWALIAKCSVVFAFITVCTSFYFWYKKSVRTSHQKYMIMVSGTFSIIFILYIWLVG